MHHFFLYFAFNFEFFIIPSIPSRKKTSYSRYPYLKSFISHRVNSSFVSFNASFISTDPFSLVALKCMCGCLHTIRKLKIQKKCVTFSVHLFFIFNTTWILFPPQNDKLHCTLKYLDTFQKQSKITYVTVPILDWIQRNTVSLFEFPE